MRWKFNRGWLFGSLTLLLVASCGPRSDQQNAYPVPPATQALATLLARGIATSDRTQYPPPIPGPLAPPPSTISPEVQSIPYPIQSAAPFTGLPAAVQSARVYLAGNLSLPIRQVSVLTWKAVVFPATDLGCTDWPELSLQNPTPGYRILLVANAQEYEAHSDESGENICLVETTGIGGRISLARARTQAQVAELARVHLANRIESAIQAVEILTVEDRVWEAEDLGCPQSPAKPTRRANAKSIPGYRIILSAKEQEYEYHSSSFWLVYCGVVR